MRVHLNRFGITRVNEVNVYACLNILCHNLLGTNRPEGWVRTDRKWIRNVWIRKIHEYETTGNRNEENLTWKMLKTVKCRNLTDSLVSFPIG